MNATINKHFWDFSKVSPAGNFDNISLIGEGKFIFDNKSRASIFEECFVSILKARKKYGKHAIITAIKKGAKMKHFSVGIKRLIIWKLRSEI